MSSFVMAIAGGATAGVIVLVIIIGFLWSYIWYRCNPANKTSESGSSDPANLDRNIGGRALSAASGSVADHRGAKQFTLEELEHATKNFSESKIVGTGRFGLVYKGLLLDGTVVAIKRRKSPPKQEFIQEVKKLADILHRNIVILIGYCQEGEHQMLVFEYIPNGSVSKHLFDTGQDSMTRLEFKQRLSIAIGAAKGLSHLHSLVPPLVHKDFKTSNVLVDENFIAKVADAGIYRLLQGSDVGSSQTSGSDIFQAPEVGELGVQTEASDIYSFGVFLLELIAGAEVSRFISPDSNETLAQWVEANASSSNALLDRRLGGGFTSEGTKELIRLTIQCLTPFSQRRPKMKDVVNELDQILETEMTLTTIMGDGTAIVTLGSQLFTSV